MKKSFVVFFISNLLIINATILKGQVPFKEIDSSYSGEKIMLAPGLKYDFLYREGDVVNNGQGKKTTSKGNHDYNAFISLKESSEEGFLFVSHETNDSSTVLGDGGGGVILNVRKIDSKWVTKGNPQNVDFSPVGGTFKNCSGCFTTNGTILSAEEFPPFSNKELFRNGAGYRDTSDFNGLKRWQNMGWMVEVDPITKKAVNKLYGMGRFSHEGVLMMPDSITVYLTDDYVPSVFFKFIANKPNKFTEGQLFAYKQTIDGQSGEWLKLPMEMDSLLDIRNVALRMGATIFFRMEWLTLMDGMIYISETGADNVNLSKEMAQNGLVADHIYKHQNNPGQFDYPHGAVLQFNPKSNKMRAYLMGGPGEKDKSKVLSNPDGITCINYHHKKYLVINEDIIGLTKGRVSPEAEKSKKYINEIWWLDLDLENPTSDDLHRFLIAPSGAETTGGYFTPDGETYFLNIQHPSVSNSPPFNKSFTIAITGFNPKLSKRKDPKK